MEIEQEVVVDAGAPAAAAEAESKQANPITDLKPEPEAPKAETPPEPEKPKEPEVPKGVQKRIDRAVREKYEAQARAKMLEERLAALEQRAAPQQQTPIKDSEPTIDKFDNFDEYVSAKAKWIAKQELESTLSEREKAQAAAREAAARQQSVESWTKRVSAATAEMPDFEDVIASSDVPMTDVMQQSIMESDIGPKLAYHLATHPEEAYKIAQLPPIRAVAALGRLEERLETAKPATKPTQAPPPVQPVGTRATASKDPGKMTDAEYAKWRKTRV
jgi:hypothetical protein